MLGLPAVVSFLSWSPRATSEGFFFNIFLVLSRAAWPELGPSVRAPFRRHLYFAACPKQPYMCKEMKKWLVKVGSMSCYPCLEETWPTEGLCGGSGLRGTRDSSAQCWHFQGQEDTCHNLVLSVRLAGVPGLGEPRSRLFGPHIRWER